MTRTASMAETPLQQHVVKLLEAYGRPDIEWHCVPNGAILPWKVARELKAMGVKAGVADLMFLIDRVSIALELKTEIGTQSNDQSSFQERFERAGGRYYIAFGLSEAIAILTKIGAFVPGIKFTTNVLDGRGARRGSATALHSPNTNGSPKAIEATQ